MTSHVLEFANLKVGCIFRYRETLMNSKLKNNYVPIYSKKVASEIIPAYETPLLIKLFIDFACVITNNSPLYIFYSAIQLYIF